LAFWVALWHVDLDMPVSCDNRRRDFLGESRRRRRMSCTVSSGIWGTHASMCRQECSRRFQLVYQMMYYGLRRSCSATKLLAKLTLNGLIRSRCPVRFHYEDALCNSVSAHLNRCTDSRQECLNRFTLACHTNTIAYPDRRSYRHD
jgi:hypothetical protein